MVRRGKYWTKFGPSYHCEVRNVRDVSIFRTTIGCLLPCKISARCEGSSLRHHFQLVSPCFMTHPKIPHHLIGLAVRGCENKSGKLGRPAENTPARIAYSASNFGSHFAPMFPIALGRKTPCHRTYQKQVFMADGQSM